MPPRRLISNNIIIAYEAMHIINNKLGGDSGFMALKLDVRRPMIKLNGIILELS